MQRCAAVNEAPQPVREGRGRQERDLIRRAQDMEEKDEQAPAGFVDKITKILRDFGLGRRSIWEGGVGTFILGGTGWFLSKLLLSVILEGPEGAFSISW